MNIIPSFNGTHSWNFTRRGGIFQVQIDTVEDLRALSTLDPKLWVALSCPVNDLEIDPRTLSLIDHDADSRVRIEEMLTAVDWTLARLSHPESLFAGGDLPLAAINCEDAEGEKLLASAKRILANMGAPEATSISVEQAANTEQIYGKSRLNGDGVIAKDASGDPELQTLIGEIMDCLGAEIDRSGEPGITKAKLDAFFDQMQRYESWWRQGEIDTTQGEDVFPLGDATPDAFKHFIAVEQKIDDFFARCQLAAFDARAEAPLNPGVALYSEIADSDFSQPRKDIEALPLARISPSSTVPILEGINPEWRARMLSLCEKVIRPLGIGPGDSLEIDEWQAVKARFEAYRLWRQSKPSTGIEKLKIKRVRALLASDLRDKINALLEEDARLAPEMKAIDSVEKLARYHRDLIVLLQNFVNFKQFYDEQVSAIFQAGELYLDGRECQLCLRVGDPTKHAVLATLSRAFVAYCECRRQDSPTKFYIAAVFSAGDSSNLIVGRNGVFRDRKGLLWDTTIVRLIENPISIHEAFLMPYVRIGRFIGEKIEKWAVTRDKAMQKQMETGVDSVGDPKATETSANGPAIGGLAAMLAAGGIALGAVGAGLASLFNTMKALTWWELPLVVLGVILMISLPSMVIAWLKLRKRTLAPLLDASGWAVNGRTLISAKLGRVLTKRASLPLSSHCKFDERSGVRNGLWAALGLTLLATIVVWLYLMF
ncbi:hypothetical protein QEH52_04120 [Coraliomargarita sp. SDUM461003]|uniref:Uncharacterized protein n=1 Tax=Thalassobacterium maritimum TaxID=3041265 RepID=A0ABU1AR95_9BACT|nr:hypothetical protein [Coraliomargarita sp. SDUM461003]MBT64604.1 hypothetical protein [Puniceicoccaceae bacterium]MDQ8206681.1 hypothetical protein [Coraliomargarita sp. SDUM461003]HBR95651.1 hypothetical protein [Opitutae bacterium]|tara:strand:- start:3189 stop:5327 length:2139 start_codon:yes stop_codon:yes gene_type:complete